MSDGDGNRTDRPDEFSLPAGTVTFLLTDVEGSTSAWEAAPTLMVAAIARHYEILDVAIAAHGGVRPQEQGEGDSVVGAFGRASDALKAAVDAQRSFAVEQWPDGLAGPLRVRMAIHTGEAQKRNEANYVGQAIIRTARLRAIAHGEQVLLSRGSPVEPVNRDVRQNSTSEQWVYRTDRGTYYLYFENGILRSWQERP